MRVLSKNIVVASICVPLFLAAADRANVMEMSTVRAMDSATIVKASRVASAVVNIACPAGWTKAFDISNSKDKWGENRPVVTCKPNRGQVINCPKGTFFYVKGNENLDGYKNGEIGCHTPVQ